MKKPRCPACDEVIKRVPDSHHWLCPNCGELYFEIIKEMLLRHKQEIAELQKRCTHPEEHWSEWKRISHMIGHPPGYPIRQCNLCGATVDRKEPWKEPDKEVE